jgi:multiple sugar transport system permease protein
VLRVATVRGLQHFALLLFLAAALFPFYWMLATSLKSPNEMLSVPPTYVPRAPSLEPYIHLFEKRHFGEYTLNSAIVASASTALSTLLAALAAYVFARFTFPGRFALMAAVLVSAMLPFISVLGPTYLIVKNLGLLNTREGLIAVYVAGGIPFAVWFLFVFFQTIPTELEDAARVDGCNRLAAFIRVTLPLSAPGLVTTIIFLFIWFWNEFIFALVLTLSPAAKTISVGITELPSIWEIPYDYMAAAGTIAALPVIFLVLFFQRYIVEGIVAGALKG